MKKIITSVGMIVFVAALVAGGTGAFFSDTETSAGNVFAAGAIDLLIDNSSYGFDWNNPGNDIDQVIDGDWIQNDDNSWELSDLDDQLFFDFVDLKPGDYGEDTISLHVQNDAWACMAFTLTSTPENEINDPEATAGDVTDGDNGGELQNYLEFVFWNDDGDNVLEEGEDIIEGLSGLAADIFTGAKLAIADSSTGEPLPANVEDEASYIAKGWCFGDLTPTPVPQDNYEAPTEGNTGFTCSGVGDHNDAQTDEIVVDVQFEAVQARHNEEFLCNPRTEITWIEEGVAADGDASLVVDEDPSENQEQMLKLTTINDVNSRVRYSYDITDIDLSAFTGFSYDSKQVSAFDTVNGNASFRLVVDLDGNVADPSDVKQVTYEPYYNIFAHNDLNSPAILPGVWQTWAANMTKGKFWASGVTTAAGVSGGGGAYATNFTIQQLDDAYPNAKIVAISIGMGTYNVDQVVLVDDLVFNGSNLGF